MAVRRLSGNRTLTVHIQDPLIRPDAFDLVVAMAHDRIPAGGNVIKVATALHDLTAENLAAAGARWRDRLGRLGRPLAGVTIGGDTKRQAFAAADGRRLIAALQRLRAGGLSLAITPSRRTPANIRTQLERAFGGDSKVFLWDLAGDNPYRGMLAFCDRLIVTGDSVSMISEALSTPHPVEVFDLGFARYRTFLGDLLERGLIRRFEGDPRPPVTAGPVNATLEAADAVRRLIQTRTAVSG